MSKAYVWKDGPTWHYEVIDHERRVLLSDNTNNWRKIFDAAFRDSAAIRRIERAGYRLPCTYADLVNKASLNL